MSRCEAGLLTSCALLLLASCRIAGLPGPDVRVLWSADFETGDLSAWYFPSKSADGNEGGGEFNSGIAASAPSQDHAHSGKWGLKMVIRTPPESGTRLFRWRELQSMANLHYTAWYYFPETRSIATYWNVMQWKSKTAYRSPDPFFVLNVANGPGGSMYFSLYNWNLRRSHTQTAKTIPVAQWVRVDAYYACAGDRTGRVAIWQDGTLLFDLRDVQTRYGDGDCSWSVDNYSSDVGPTPGVTYVDDVAIWSEESVVLP